MLNLKNLRKSKSERIKIKEKKLIDKMYHNPNKRYIKKGMLKNKIANSQIFTNVNFIDKGIISLKDGTFAKFFRVTPIDLSLTNKEEQELFFYTLSQVYKLKCPIKAYKYDEKLNLNGNKVYYDKLLHNAKNNIQMDILSNNKNFIDVIESENLTYTSSYFFSIIGKNVEELENNITEFERLCNGTNPKLYITKIDNKKELYKILSMIYFSNTSLDHLIYYDLFDLIVPLKLKEYTSTIKIDDKNIQLIAIKNYPPFIEKDFLNTIVNIPNVNVSFTIKDTVEKERIIKTINSNYKSLLADYNSTKNVAEVNELKHTLENYRLLIEQLANNDEKIKEVTIVLAISGTKKERDEIIKTIRENATPKGIKVDVPKLRQMELWQSYDLTSNTVEDYSMYLPTYTLASGFAFTKSYHNDTSGYLIGEDARYGLPIFWDIFYSDKKKRTSYNVSVVGSTGAGKSFLLKKMIVNELARGTKVFIWDVENEFKKLTNRYPNSEYINLANKVLINPLQVRFLPEDDEEEDSSILNRHLGFLEAFYSSMFEEITEKEKVVLLDITEKLYNARGITSDSTLEDFYKYSVNDYPILSDLYIFLNDYKKNIKNNEEIKILTNLEVLLKRFVVGQDTIFNGHTAISLDSQLMCFNLKSLTFNDNKRLANAQILNLLTFLNNEIIGKNDINVSNKRNPVMIVADEFHNFINDDNPAIIKYFDQMTRRLRKYNSSLVLATQSPQDLVSSDMKTRNATAIFNNCQYNLIGMLKSNDLDAVEKIYKTDPLTETQKSFLNTAEMGDFLLNLNYKNRLRVSVFATLLERYYMGDEEEMTSQEENNEEITTN